ncbi:hypothetical protein VF13_42545 [Nostoc linckia z16]|nr:hypothetical protein VF13_42545 [Nostoc linckia z16]
MEFLDSWPFRQKFAIHRPLPEHCGYIVIFYLVAPRNTFIASAKRTHAFAKREVYVQAYPFGEVAFLKSTQHGTLPYIGGKARIFPIRYSWIAGVSWPGDIIFLDDRIIHSANL